MSRDAGPAEVAYARALGHRIKNCRGGRSRDEFANALGVHPNTVGKFERGDTMPDAHTLTRIALLGQCSAQWLLTGAEMVGGIDRALHAVERGGYVYVPHFDVQAATGGDLFDDLDAVIAMRAFEVAYVRRVLGIAHNDLALITVTGALMRPQLHSRDMVLLDLRARDVATEGIHALRIDGALLVKKVQRLPGKTLRISNENAAYGSFDVVRSESPEQDFAVIGRVRWGGVTFD
ncbi:XRE family transcriptional regulator [Xylophilus sp. ASV27]|uniref:XRE family transcriptional regulator n=1 Tax=Xylophilus sp. ASV27 TaxID=2795129 RepID=UPI0018EA69EE|nr:XRE family transcriptional regulator [Xylophilus sp. ASV27]